MMGVIRIAVRLVLVVVLVLVLEMSTHPPVFERYCGSGDEASNMDF
jgi:hypothetical protein